MKDISRPRIFVDRRASFAVVGGICLMLLLIVYNVYTGYGVSAAYIAEYNSLRRLAAAMEHDYRLRDENIQRIDALNSELAEVLGKVRDYPEPHKYIRDFDSAISKHSFESEYFLIGEVQTVTVYDGGGAIQEFFKIPVEVIVEGAYNEIRDYIAEMTDSDSTYFVESIEISPVSGEPENVRLAMTLAAYAKARYMPEELKKEVQQEQDVTINPFEYTQ